MKKIIAVIFITLLIASNAHSATFRFDGTLDLYTGEMLTDSASVTGDFSFSGEDFNSDFTGTFSGTLFGLPVSGELIIPNGTDNPVISPLSILWNGNNLNGDLLIEVSFTSLDVFQITSLDGDDDGIPGTAFTNGASLPSSLALSGEFTVVPLPAAFWLLSSGLALFTFSLSNSRRKANCAT